MPIGIDSGTRFDKSYQISYIFQLADLGGGKFYLERLLNGEKKAKMGQAIPAIGRPLAESPGVTSIEVSSKTSSKMVARRVYLCFIHV